MCIYTWVIDVLHLTLAHVRLHWRILVESLIGSNTSFVLAQKLAKATKTVSLGLFGHQVRCVVNKYTPGSDGKLKSAYVAACFTCYIFWVPTYAN